jgi:hypothetical protein
MRHMEAYNGENGRRQRWASCQAMEVRVHPRYKPRAGQIILVEGALTDPDLEPLSGLVVRVGGGRVTITSTGSSPPPADGSRVITSHFAPEALYRMTATARTADKGVLILEDCQHLQTVQRRSWPRSAMRIPITLASVDADVAGVRGETIDISIGGAHVWTAAAVEASDDLLATLTMPDGGVLLVASRVVWSTVVSARCEYRIAFCDLDEVETGKIGLLVRSASAAAPLVSVS